MSEDASLDDFLGGESSEQSEAADADTSTGDTEAADADTSADDTEAADADTSTGDTEPTDETTSPDVEPATTTYAWSGEGAACGACGETVEQRWQQDGGLVCIDCKDWEQA